MYNLAIPKRVVKGLDRYPHKIHRQIIKKVLALQFDPRPRDSKKIGSGFRVDSGEYRIYYEVDDEEQQVSVELIGKRNDDEVYRRLRRLKK